MNGVVIWVILMAVGFIIDSFFGSKSTKKNNKKKVVKPLVNKKQSEQQPKQIVKTAKSLGKSLEQKQSASNKKAAVKLPKIPKTVVHDMSNALDEEYEDEESFNTELTTPMSMEVDDGEVFTDDQWEKMAAIPVTPTHQKKVKKDYTLRQKAYIYSQIFDKPKGLE